MRTPLPPPPAPEPNTTRQQYRAALALYLLATLPDHGPIATAALSDDQLEEASYGLHDALCGRSISIDDQPTPILVYDALARAQAFVRSMQTGRAILSAGRLEQSDIDAGSDARTAYLSADDHPAGGKTIPIPPPPPRPLSPQHQDEPHQDTRRRLQEVF